MANCLCTVITALRQFKALEAQLAEQSKVNAAQATKNLFAAATSGDLASVQTAIQSGANVNAPQQGGYTAIHAACRNGFLQIVQLLLQQGADPKMDTEFNKDARQIAEKQGHTTIVQLLAPLCPEKEPKDKSGTNDDDLSEIIRQAIAQAEVEVAKEDAEEGGQKDGMFNFSALDDKLANTIGGLVGADDDDDQVPVVKKAVKKVGAGHEEMICIPAGKGKLGLSLGIAAENTVFVKGLNKGASGEVLRAQSAGLMPGDVVLTVNGLAVFPTTVADQLAKAKFPLVIAVTRK